MKQGIDYDESFSPCTKLETVRLIQSLAIQHGWQAPIHADVPNAYLHGKMDRIVVTRVPLYWNKVIGSDLGKDGDLVILDKALYGAKNAGRAWNDVIHKQLLSTISRNNN